MKSISRRVTWTRPQGDQGAQSKTIDTGFSWYDKTNITDPKIAAVLYD